MPNRESVFALSRWALIGATCFVVVYLALVALSVVPPLGWFGRPGPGETTHPASPWPTIVVAAVLIIAVCAVADRAQRARRAGTLPIGVIGILAAISAVLALSSYAKCGDPNHQRVLYPLMWAANTVKGGISDTVLPVGDPGHAGMLCPSPAPAALHIARLAGMSALYVGLASIALALLTAQRDRARIRLARRVTAVVDVDAHSHSLVTEICRNLERSRSRLAVIVADSKVAGLRDLRAQGACILGVHSLDALQSLALWRKLDRLYLLSADPSANLRRLAAINRAMGADPRSRLPLIVRIDDPWQAQSWRAQQLATLADPHEAPDQRPSTLAEPDEKPGQQTGGSDTRWAADAVGVYEITADRLLDHVQDTGQLSTLIICGTSSLTLALCATLARRRLEHNFYPAADAPPPAVTLVGEDAEEYRRNHASHQRKLGLAPDTDWLTAVEKRPTVSALTTLIEKAAGGPTGIAVVMVTDQNALGADASLSTRLAAEFPMLPIFVCDSAAPQLHDEDLPPIVGQLRTFRLAMDRAAGQAQDAWERAARLIHEDYRTKTTSRWEGSLPWDQLDEFFKESNRRQVRNALWMVERIGGHTWDAFGGPPDPVASVDPKNTDPPERLCTIGFDRDAVIAMAKAEHQDWCRYYHKRHWTEGPQSFEKKQTPFLRDWEEVQADPDEEVRKRPLYSLESTICSLRKLGYRSRPRWRRFQRTGIVTAVHRMQPWSWTTESGQTMKADAGDWEVSDGVGRSWSVRDSIFQSRYEHVDGNRWRRVGFVHARPACEGEAIETLEGSIHATGPAWLLMGASGDRWVVPEERFTRHYKAVDST